MRARTYSILWLSAALSAPSIGWAQAVVDPPGSRRVVALTTPRVQPLPESEWTDVHKQIVARFTTDGRADNALKTLLRVPELAEGVMPYTTYLSNETSLSPRVRELLILRIAWLAGSQPIWASHVPRARIYGLDEAAIRRIAEGPDAGGWDRFDATLLRLADQQFRNSSTTNATWRALSERYDLFNIIDAVETVNHFTTLSIFYNSLGVQPDEDTKDRLPADVPYRVNVPAREPPLTVARVLPNAGRGIAVGRTFGRYPALSRRWSPRQAFIQRTSKMTPQLTPPHREMLILRMGWNCQAEYEWAKHVGSVGRAREIGLDPVKIAEGADAPAWPPFEKHILHVADELYRDGMVSDATWRGLSERFETTRLMSAIYSSAVYRAISMSLNAYGVQLDGPEDERLPNIRGRGGRSGQ
jgi:4-carboxymuconolactone decarboxylase